MWASKRYMKWNTCFGLLTRVVIFMHLTFSLLQQFCIYDSQSCGIVYACVCEIDINYCIADFSICWKRSTETSPEKWCVNSSLFFWIFKELQISNLFKWNFQIKFHRHRQAFFFFLITKCLWCLFDFGILVK